MLSIGNGARVAVQSSVAGLGSNVINIQPGSSQRGGVRGGSGTGIELTIGDMEAVRRLRSVQAVTPIMASQGQLVGGGSNWATGIQGVSPEWRLVRNWEPARGRMFTEAEVSSAANVVLLGRVTAHKLFGSANPVGESLRIQNVPFTILGVLDEKGAGSWGSYGDDLAVIPYTTAQRKLIGTTKIHSMVVSARRSDRVRATEHEVLMLLKERHRVSPDDEDAFHSYNQATLSKMLAEHTRIFTLLLGSIASVSLLVGGIGIMNIMLVSVTERIREIGAQGHRGTTLRHPAPVSDGSGDAERPGGHHRHPGWLGARQARDSHRPASIGRHGPVDPARRRLLRGHRSVLRHLPRQPGGQAQPD